MPIRHAECRVRSSIVIKLSSCTRAAREMSLSSEPEVGREGTGGVFEITVKPRPSSLQSVCVRRRAAILTVPRHRGEGTGRLGRLDSEQFRPSPRTGSRPDGKVHPSANGFAMTSDPRKSLINFDILAIVSVCGLLFIAAIREIGLPLWSIPAMTLFAVAGLTLLCALPFAGDLRRFNDPGRQAS
jgi:hypothetical protein